MIKKIIGIVASLSIVTLIVFVVLGRGTYKSMLPDNIFSVRAIVEQPQEQPQEASSGENEVVELVDSIVMGGPIEPVTAEEEVFDNAEIAAESGENMVEEK